jgi:hypothetical protein
MSGDKSIEFIEKRFSKSHFLNQMLSLFDSNSIQDYIRGKKYLRELDKDKFQFEILQRYVKDLTIPYDSFMVNGVTIPFDNSGVNGITRGDAYFMLAVCFNNVVYKIQETLYLKRCRRKDTLYRYVDIDENIEIFNQEYSVDIRRLYDAGVLNSSDIYNIFKGRNSIQNIKLTLKRAKLHINSNNTIMSVRKYLSTGKGSGGPIIGFQSFDGSIDNGGRAGTISGAYQYFSGRTRRLFFTVMNRENDIIDRLDEKNVNLEHITTYLDTFLSKKQNVLQIGYLGKHNPESSNLNEVNFIGDVHLNGFIVEKSEDDNQDFLEDKYYLDKLAIYIASTSNILWTWRIHDNLQYETIDPFLPIEIIS